MPCLQIDLNSVVTATGETSLCNHNCTIANGYDCPAAFTYLKQPVKATFPSAKILLEKIEIGIAGLKTITENFIQTKIHTWAKDFNVPQNRIDEHILELRDTVEVNLFGGNPEMHPELETIIDGLSEYNVTLTTTGRKTMLSKKFSFVLDKVDTVALSADSILPSDMGLDALGLREAWKNVSVLNGQRQKSLEALYTALETNTHVLFNYVIHPDNYLVLENTIELLRKHFPKATVNAFVFQEAFAGLSSEPNLYFMKILGAYALSEIKRQYNVYYWILIYTLCQMQEWDMLLGGAWNCYSNTGVPVVQIGKGDGKGTSLSCYWNESVTVGSELKLVSDVVEWSRNMLQDVEKPCKGCLFPRLLSGQAHMEMGLDLRAKKTYLENRYVFLGY